MNIGSLPRFRDSPNLGSTTLRVRTTWMISWRGRALTLRSSAGLLINAANPCGGALPREWPLSVCIRRAQDSEPYYQVALSRAETGAVIIPDLALRLHPGVAALKESIASDEFGAFRVVRLEADSGAPDVDLVRVALPGVVDVIRACWARLKHFQPRATRRATSLISS